MEKQAIKKAAKKKAKKVVTKELARVVPANTRRYLASQSYYLASLMDPLNYPGSKIPDITSLPSATVQCRQKVQTSVNAQFVAGLFMKCGSLDTAALQVASTTATTTVLAWTNVTKSYAVGLASVAMSKRLVSASISMEYQGAPLNRKGRIISSFDNPVSSSTNPSGSSVNADLLIRPYTLSVNLAAKPYATTRYMPSDSSSFSYTNINTTSPLGYLYLVVDGANVGDIVEFTVVENYEFVPANSSLALIEPTPSISDPIEMSVAQNALSLTPSFPVIQPPKPADLPQMTMTAQGGMGMDVHAPNERKHSGNEPTMFENVLGGIKSALPVAKDVVSTGVSIAKTLAPLLAVL